MTFSSSSPSYLFQLPISYCLYANHDRILTSSSFSICKTVSQDFSTKHILPPLLFVPSLSSATEFAANPVIFSTSLQNQFWNPSFPFYPTLHPNLSPIQNSGLHNRLSLHSKSYKTLLVVRSITKCCNLMSALIFIIIHN